MDTNDSGTYRVVEAHESEFLDPVAVSKGDEIEVTERVVSRGSVAGWRWCETTDGYAGWIPSRNLRKTR